MNNNKLIIVQSQVSMYEARDPGETYTVQQFVLMLGARQSQSLTIVIII